MDTCEHGMNVGQCGFCYGNLQQERDRLREVLKRVQKELKSAWDRRILPADAISGETIRLVEVAMNGDKDAS